MAERTDGGATLIVEVRWRRSKTIAEVRARLDRLVLGAADGPSLTLERHLAIDPRRTAPFDFRAPAPAGEHGKVTLAFSALEITTVDGKVEAIDLAEPASSFAIDLALPPNSPSSPISDLALSGRLPRLEVTLAPEALRGAKAPADFLEVAVAGAPGAQTFEAAGALPATFRFGLAAVALAPRALPAGAEVVLAAPPAADLPALFRGQQRVGPPLEVRIAGKLAAPAEVTVPYDRARLARAGVAPERAVVLALDDARTRYRELRPIAVDPRAATLTVRTRSFSTFFVCTPGIEVLTPELVADGFGRILGTVSEDVATIAGRTSDPSARVALLQPAAPHSWASAGWFDFEDVPLDAGVVTVRLQATVDGELPHECEFTIRCGIAPRRITDPARFFGPSLAIAEGDRPWVTAVVQQGRFNSRDLFPAIAGWQESYQRYGPYVYRPSDALDEWIWAGLLPEAHFENEASKLAIRMLAQTVAIALDPAAPEPTRALASLGRFVAALPAGDLRRPVIDFVLERTRPLFGPAALSISPRVPIRAAGTGFLAAFVAATLEGTDAALLSGLGSILGRLYGALEPVFGERPHPRAGRLFFVASDGVEPLRRETVADGIWCAGAALAIDPESGLPVIAAIGLANDVPGGPGPGGAPPKPQPRSRLLLYRRQVDGGWTEELVLADRPVVDVDLAIAPNGDVRLVAAVAASDIEIKTHAIAIRRVGGAWRAETLALEVEVDGLMRRLDRGIWPRIAIDGRDRSVIVLGEWHGGWRWHVAVEDGAAGFRARHLRTARWLDLSGSPLPTDFQGIQIDDPVSASEVSPAHWAPALALAGPTTAWCAYANGMLNLARIDLDTLAIEDGPIAVDRATGYFPALAIKRDGAPAVVFKDPWGPGTRGDRDDLVYLATDDGGVVPDSGAGSHRFGPVLPPYSSGAKQLLAFAAEHVPLTCDRLLDPDTFPYLLASIIRSRRFHFALYPSDGTLPPYRLSFQRSHLALDRLIDGLPRRPSMLVSTIDNGDFPGEDIERIDITTFLDPIFDVDGALAAGLDGGTVSGALVAALAARGVALHPDTVEVTRIADGSAWDVADREAFRLGANILAQTYQLRLAGDRLEVRLPPVLSAFDGTDNHDGLGRLSPCNRDQDDWDVLAGPLVGRFAGSPITLPDTPGTLLWLALRNLRVSRFEPWDPPGSDQQGAMRFTLEIANLVARNDEPDADIYSIEPSFVHVVVAPSVVRAEIRKGVFADTLSWWVREAEVRIGRVEVDADVGVFDWLRFLAIIPGVGFLLLAADPIADAIATSEVNDRLVPPDTTSFQGLFRDSLAGWVDAELGESATGIESVYLRDGMLRLWRRGRLAGSPRSQLGVLPATLSFGSATIGGGPVLRRLALTSDGGVPSLVESVRVVAGGPEMRLDAAPAGPFVLDPGAASVLTLTFDPQAPAGFRTGELEVIANGGRRTVVPLLANAMAPLAPTLHLRPESRLAFGVVVVGQRRREAVEIRNDGQAPLVLAPPRIEGDAALAAAFTLAPPPLSLAPGGAAEIGVTYAPPVGGPPRHDATLVLESNDPDRPRVELPLIGFASALGSVLVQPVDIAFSDTVIEANQPPLPPGLPPTVHLGSVRSTTVYNLGPGPLTVLAASYGVLAPGGVASPHFRLWLTDGSVPAAVDRVLQGGESLTLVVQFLPTAVGAHTATVTLRTSDAAQPAIEVHLTGTGIV